MTPTSEERREVAARLRNLPSDAYNSVKELEKDGIFIDLNIEDEADYSQIHNAVFGCFPAEYMHPGDYEEFHDRLADLIDCPTCRNVSGYQDVFECSECGCRVELTAEVCNEYGEPFHMPFMPLFCPGCGAEVVDDDDSRRMTGEQDGR